MARMMFGGGPEDVYLVTDDQNDLQAGGGATVLFYSAETGGTPITDLLDRLLSPITQVLTSTGSDGRAAGQIAPFYGPDAVYEMWASANSSPRFLMQASNLGGVLGSVKDQYDQHVAQHNGHSTGLKDLVDVNSASVTGVTDGQILTYDAANELWVVSTPTSTPSNMVTTNTAQTVTALKTLTGGAVVKPATASGVGAIVQGLGSQSGNVQEWRDSAGTTLAWVTAAGGVRAPNLGRTITFTKVGPITTGVGTFRWYVDTAAGLTVLSVRVNVGTASSSGSITVDVNKNGSTIFTTQSGRPVVTASGFTSGKNTSMNVAALASGDYVTADIDTAGTGAADMVVQIELG